MIPAVAQVLPWMFEKLGGLTPEDPTQAPISLGAGA